MTDRPRSAVPRSTPTLALIPLLLGIGSCEATVIGGEIGAGNPDGTAVLPQRTKVGGSVYER